MVAMTAWQRAMLEAAKEVQAHWSTSSDVVNAKEQAERSARVLLRMAKETK